MDRGVRLVCPASAYSRYNYFYKHIKEFLPRFYKIVDKGKLSGCIANGEKRLKEIDEQWCNFNDTVTVSLFDDSSAITKEVLVIDDYDISKIEETSSSLDQFRRETKNATFFHCHIAVCRIKTEQFRESISCISPVTDNQKENIIVVTDTDKNYILKDIPDDSEYPPENFASDDPLSKIIQRVLETKIVHCIDTITAFVHKFVPNEKQHTEKKLISLLRRQFLPFMRNVSVITDLSPDHGIQIDDHGRPVDPTSLDEETKTKIFHRKLTEFSTKKTTNILCSELAVRSGLAGIIVHKLISDDSFDLEKKISEINKTVTIDPWPSEYGPEGAVYVCRKYGYDFTKALKDVIDPSEEWIKKKMKCFELMMKLEFELHGVLARAQVPYETVIPQIPVIPYELQCALLDIQKVDSCGHKYGRLVIHVSEILAPVDKSQINNLLQKHRYNYSYTTEIAAPFTPQVKTTVEIEVGNLIRTKSETGTETQWFLATIGCFVKVKKKHKNKQKSKKKHDQTASSKTSEKNPKDRELYNREPESKNQSQKANDVPVCKQTELELKQLDAVTDVLYGVTCAHCVEDTHPNVEVNEGNTWASFGRVIKEYNLYEPYSIDMSLIEVLSEKGKLCNLKAKLPCGVRSSDTWEVLNRRPEPRMQVYMIGAITKVKHGTIVETDRMDKSIKQFNKGLQEKMSSKKGQKRPFFHPVYTMLIEPKAEYSSDGSDTKSTESGFSKDGDSGSVIWFVEPDNRVFAVALLCGKVQEGPTIGELHYSYASNINQVFEVFEERFNCTIKPACSHDHSSTESEGESQTLEGAVGGLDLGSSSKCTHKKQN